jgi:hypothetical protein
VELAPAERGVGVGVVVVGAAEQGGVDAEVVAQAGPRLTLFSVKASRAVWIGSALASWKGRRASVCDP